MAGRRFIALLALMLAGCGSPQVSISPTPSATPTAGPTGSPFIDHPTGALDVVLRMSSEGGLPRYIGPTYTRPADFTLYGDGRVIYIVDSGQPPRLMQARLTDQRVTEVLDYALDDGGLRDADRFYAEAEIADDATTHFVINTAEVHKLVDVYAVHFVPDDGPDRNARESFDALARALSDFESSVVDTNSVDLGEFIPSAYSVTLDQNFGPEVTAGAAWPWHDLVPADFGLINDVGNGELVVDAAHGEAVLAIGIWDGLIVTGPNGMLYQIKIKPLLPDEVPA